MKDAAEVEVSSDDQKMRVWDVINTFNAFSPKCGTANTRCLNPQSWIPAVLVDGQDVIDLMHVKSNLKTAARYMNS